MSANEKKKKKIYHCAKCGNELRYDNFKYDYIYEVKKK